MINRRNFLVSASAAAVAASLPMPPLASAAPAAEAAVSSPLLAFAVGTPGEYDWQTFFARSAERAFNMWKGEQDEFEEGEEPEFDPDCVHRVPSWDGKKEGDITPADWFAANMGHICDRCGYETHPDSGGLAVGDDVICEECVTFADQVLADPDRAVELLADRIYDDGADAARDWLVEKGLWASVEPAIWPQAVKAAAA